MARPQSGLLTPLAAQVYMDGLASWFKRVYPMGLGLTSEASTVAYYGQQTIAKIMGDGSANYGIDNSSLQSLLSSNLNSLSMNSRYDVFVSSMVRSIIGAAEQTILQNLPSGWSYTGGSARAFDALLTRFNGTSASTPAKPAGTLTVAAATGGSIEAGTATKVKVSCVGAYDYLESQPCTEATASALVAPNNAFTLGGLTGNVPSGVTKLRIYRQLLGDSAGDYYWDQDVAVTAGTAWSVYLTSGASEIKITQPDVMLRQDIRPVVYCQCLSNPEFAALYALSSSTIGSGNDPLAPVTYQQYGQLSPHVVAANPINEYLGVGNPASSAQFGSLNTASTFTAGSLITTNAYLNRLQGFAGSYNANLQARVTTILNSASTITAIVYKYFDATNPTTIQTATVGSLSIALSAAVGSLADIGVTAGRLVTQVTALTQTGAATGVFLIEPKPVRSI